jgi:hypothetical protein
VVWFTIIEFEMKNNNEAQEFKSKKRIRIPFYQKKLLFLYHCPVFLKLVNTFVYLNSVYVWSMSMSMSMFSVNCAVLFTLFFVSILVPIYLYVFSVIKHLFNFNSFFLSFCLFITVFVLMSILFVLSCVYICKLDL